MEPDCDPRCYDPRCLELSEYFLDGYPPDLSRPALAALIQRAIEDWFISEDAERRKEAVDVQRAEERGV